MAPHSIQLTSHTRRFTTHTGCPILEGSKLITAQWMRTGVTEQEHWSRYDSAGAVLQ